MAGKDAGGLFAKAATQHVLILASGDRMRHMVVRPWMAAIAFCFISVVVIGHLAATSYMVLRDDLLGAAIARQARMQHDYEDRIAALRAQLDRVTSRQLLDQQLVEQKVERLLEQQSALADRHGRLGSILDRASQSGIGEAPAPETPASDTRQRRADISAQDAAGAIAGILGTARPQPAPSGSAALGFMPIREKLARGTSAADRADRIFSKVTHSLQDIETGQLRKIARLTGDAARTAGEIETILKRTGIDMSRQLQSFDDHENGVGGPFEEPVAYGDGFEQSLDELDAALKRLQLLRDTAQALPFDSPAPGAVVTSRFGNRVDPFLGRLAMHAGIDFRAATGDPVRAPGAGRVITAAHAGGYGNMVEIDHGFGITTRFGHLSNIRVGQGERVEAGAIIGNAGSTGRSTGPHLHYEVRRNGSAIDPQRFLNAGLKLESYLN